ncbi:MAG: hypothetical protein HFH16_01985 [Ruminococcus sp.]|jgi:hypothetical protein|uniref:Uncharacterized protein n=1 Tax=Schaedlerella arabinosiphila TaxID=2044587 RepID=A0A426DNK8_9FIRM|nr:DUF6147 family protein [Schaedlerella arabinosiphila]MCI8722478.1 hypothetical protein [Ruminococcus sp.]RRK34333.1 hypothetical protein EBB54_25625 [Schaedlerella arabinosiphila]
MKRKIVVMACFIFALCGMLLTIPINVDAEEVVKEEKIIDGSYLTFEDYSYGTTVNPTLRGEHLMTGDSIITKTGIGKIYTYGETTANHDVDFVAVLVYVDRYDESDGLWGQIDAHVKDARDTYYAISTKTLKVDRGYFYRVHCDHFAGNDDEEFYDEAISATDGIWIP